MDVVCLLIVFVKELVSKLLLVCFVVEAVGILYFVVSELAVGVSSPSPSAKNDPLPCDPLKPPRWFPLKPLGVK